MRHTRTYRAGQGSFRKHSLASQGAGLIRVLGMLRRVPEAELVVLHGRASAAFAVLLAEATGSMEYHLRRSQYLSVPLLLSPLCY